MKSPGPFQKTVDNLWPDTVLFCGALEMRDVYMGWMSRRSAVWHIWSMPTSKMSPRWVPTIPPISAADNNTNSITVPVSFTDWYSRSVSTETRPWNVFSSHWRILLGQHWHGKLDTFSKRSSFSQSSFSHTHTHTNNLTLEYVHVRSNARNSSGVDVAALARSRRGLTVKMRAVTQRISVLWHQSTSNHHRVLSLARQCGRRGIST